MAGRATLCRAGVLAASLLTVVPGLAFAQSSGVLFPQSIAITNYDRVLVGQEEALEAERSSRGSVTRRRAGTTRPASPRSAAPPSARAPAASRPTSSPWRGWASSAAAG